jgi:tetratricopeptide (TPR) repeat protein
MLFQLSGFRDPSAMKQFAGTLGAGLTLFVMGLFSVVKGQSDLTAVVSHIRSSVVTVVAFNGDGKPTTQGTGFFVAANGTLITNNHVVANAARVSIKTKSGVIYDIVQTVAEDFDGDLVALRADLRGLAVRPLRLSSAPVASGQRIFVIGSPLGLDETVSEGIISAVRQIDGIGRVIQITAPISPGSSGSPVVNARGEIIGVASLNLMGGQNLNFAIPSTRVIALLVQHRTLTTGRSLATRTGRNNAAAKAKKKEIDDAAFDKMFARMWEDERKSIPVLEDRIAKDSKDINAYESLGLAYSNNGQPRKAIEVYERGLRFAPNNESFHASLCDVYSTVEEHYKALLHCDKALALKPSNSYALTNKGRSLVGLGRIPEAIEVLKEAVKEDPTATNAHEQLGFIYMNLGQYEDAAKAFEFMASIASRYAPSFVDLAWAYESLGRNVEAEDCYKKALQIDKELSEASIRLAKLYEGENRESDAVSVYKQAIKVNAKNADAYLNLGLLYLLIGDRKSTLDIYQALKILDPDKARQLSSAIYK